MVVLEIPKSPPAITISTYGSSIQNYSYFCTRRCAFLELSLSAKSGCNQLFDRAVVSLLEGTVGWFGSTKCRSSFVTLFATSTRNNSSLHLPNKASSRIEYESICEEDGLLIRGNPGDFDETSVVQILPPWGGSAKLELGYHIPIGKTLTVPERTCGLGEDKFHYLEERDKEILSERIRKLSRLNKVRSVLALYRSMKLCGIFPNLHSCNSILSCLLRNGRLHDAKEIFEFMKENDVISSHSYSLILKGVACSKSWNEALAMFEEAEIDNQDKKYLDTVVYNTMIAVLGRVNNWVQVERMWRTLQKNGHVGTVVTYRLLICIFTRTHQNELALDAYHEMVQNGLNPSLDALEAIIGASTREGKWEMALNAFDKISKTGFQPSLTSCNAIINSLGKAGQGELAFKVYIVMKSFGHAPDAYSLNSLLSALYRANQYADALRLFEIIRKDYKTVLNLHVYNTCLMCCRKLGLWEKSMQLLWQMEMDGFALSVTSYNLVIGACEAARKPEIAYQVYEHMVQQRTSPDIFTLLSLIRSCIWGSLWRKVEEILNSTPNGSLYNAAIQGMCLRRKPDMARELYIKMRKKGLKPDGKTRALILQNLPRIYKTKYRFDATKFLEINL